VLGVVVIRHGASRRRRKPRLWAEVCTLRLSSGCKSRLGKRRRAE
jgi:hypothetical protein